MALRLIEMVLREKNGGETRELLKEHKLVDCRLVRLPDGVVLVRILPAADRSEVVLDLLEKQYASAVGNRVMILPVEATLPRAIQEPEPAPGLQSTPEERSPERIAREECTRTSKTPHGARKSIWR